jgi:NAD(P)-dependent dehydrogenase (short-subunit alcohol dehydrogenase family)
MDAPLAGRRAVVTGASQGIGAAAARALASRGARVGLVARSRSELDKAAVEIGSGAVALAADLTEPGSAQMLAADIERRWGGLDILVHCAAAYRSGTTAELELADWDVLYRSNLRAPVALTRALLPQLLVSRGQIVFVNSTVVRASNLAGRGAYAATKAALRAFADSLRDEVNAAGVRVITVYPGSTATPLQEALHAERDVRYNPERLLQPEDVAETLCSALAMPGTAEITDLFVRPMLKS